MPAANRCQGLQSPCLFEVLR